MFETAFNQEVKSSQVAIKLSLQTIGSKDSTALETIPVKSGKVFTSKIFSLNNSLNQNKLINASIVSGSTILYALEDFIDLTRYQTSIPMIARFSLAQTRANSNDIYNNLLGSHDVNTQPVDVGNAYSHYILDLDRLLQAKAVSGWGETKYGSAPVGDGFGRIPLVLVHGWQGDCGYRSAARLCDWEHSPVNYFYKFISYYLGSPELHQKYHVYLVRWPSYKHLSFSGNILSQMLVNVRQKRPDTDLGIGMSNPGTGVVVITHSTGGLITRSAIESYLAFSDHDSAYAYLRKAILLASPNHGTPEATDTWPNNWTALANKDVGTQSTSDLEWDSFDGNSNIYFSLGPALIGHRLDYSKDRSQSRWPSKYENVRDFDLNYLNRLKNMSAATYNPWLLWFTRNFASLKESLASKYTLYSGWTRITGDPGNFVNNHFSMAFAQGLLSMAGYHSDSVLPICSNLMATSKNDKGFYLPAPNPLLFIEQDWYPNSQLYSIDELMSKRNVIVIGDSRDHPLGMEFRMIWDFDHMQTVSGSLSGTTQAAVAALIDQPINANISTKDDFWMDKFRQGYVRGAYTYNTGSVPADNTLSTLTNKLKADPFFLILEKDLLNAAVN